MTLDTKESKLGGSCAATMLGSSTWGDDIIEFQEDFAPFFEELNLAPLKGKNVAVFGCGDSSYPHFCGAVDLLEERMLNLGANLLNEPLRIDGDPEGAFDDIQTWVEEIIEKTGRET